MSALTGGKELVRRQERRASGKGLMEALMDSGRPVKGCCRSTMLVQDNAITLLGLSLQKDAVWGVSSAVSI
jgi:hypothetical protein